MKAVVDLSKYHQFVLLAALVVHMIAAWYSTGYYSADEHFQIVAFAQSKLGELPVEHLPWEYDAGIRSSLQPWIAMAVFRAAELVGITDPFNRTLLLRLLTALLALLAVRGFVQATISEVPDGLKRSFILLSYFLWFLPYLHVRFSSEGLAGVFLLFGIGAVLRIVREREEDLSGAEGWRNGEDHPIHAETSSRKRSDGRSLLNLLWAGVAFGIAVLCRPPVGLIVISVVLWLAIVVKVRWIEVFYVIGGIVAIAIVGFVLDSAFYGKPLFSVWEYVRMGFAGDPEHRFDELPWHYYAPWIVKYAIPPIGVCVLLAMAISVWKRPKHLLVWCILPFFVVHSFIPHKELRFIFPLADLAPLLLVIGFVEVKKLLHGSHAIWGMVVGILVFANLLGLSVVMTSAAGIGRTVLAAELHDLQLPKGMRITYVIDPLQAWRISLPAFYMPLNLTDSAFTMDRYGGGPLKTDYLVARSEDAKILGARSSQRLEPIARTESAWTEHLMRWYTWGEGPEPWSLYRVRN